jgi:hypothetical protein
MLKAATAVPIGPFHVTLFMEENYMERKAMLIPSTLCETIPVSGLTSPYEIEDWIVEATGCWIDKS